MHVTPVVVARDLNVLQKVTALHLSLPLLLYPHPLPRAQSFQSKIPL